MAATTTDIREWAKEQGFEVRAKGPVTDDLRARYAAAHNPDDYPAELEDQDQAADVAAAAPPPPPPADHAERAPARPRPKTADRGRAILGRWFPARPAGKKPAGRRPARVSLAGLIEDAWGQMAWAASPLPPMQRLLQAQAPFAGIAMEDALAGTVADRVLQPIARAEDKAKAVGGLIMPPAALMLVMATAPAPEITVDPATGADVASWPEPSLQHKSALLTLRWSLMLWSEAGAARLEEYRARAEASADRGRAADQFMSWILGFEDQSAAGAPDAVQAAVTAEEEAVRRAQDFFGG